jgi:radical SAM superfamily enzyme YgiQ (UPF0313 family)
MSVLLVHPPFAASTIPPLALAALAAHLRQLGITVETLDANLEFYRHAAAPDRVAAAAGRSAQRLAELESLPRRSDQEELEMAFCLKARDEFDAWQGGLREDASGHDRLPLPRLNRAFEAALCILSTASFPERVEYCWPGVFFHAPESIFGSAEIRAAAERDGVFENFFEESLRHRLDAARLVGLSVNYPQQIIPAMRCARVIRSLAPRIHITVGGAFVASHLRTMRSTALFDLVDSFVDGDGERPLEMLIRELDRPEPDLDRVPNLIHARDGAIRRNAAAPPIPMDDLPAPDFDDFDLDRYPIRRSSLWLPLRISQGCSWGCCAFCRDDLIRVCRRPSVEKALSWIEATRDRTGIHRFNFTDDEAPTDLLEKLCASLIAKKTGIDWTATHRFEACLDAERCRLYRASGCRFLFLGLESLSDRILQLMRKGISRALIERTLRNLKEAGIRTHAFMIVGFPTETEEEARSGFALLRHFVHEGLLTNYNYSSFVIMPHSDVARRPGRYGILSITDAHAEADLEHLLPEFDCNGMTRATARRLVSEFHANATA